ncbi:MAG: HAMP domain-containing protein [Betaproteobacteria bacterium]|nr:HAMP domain-containing protein [Betaproteobacteria bacterium]
MIPISLIARFKGLSSKIYVAFLVTAAVPVMVAGLVGIYFSVEALKNETLHHLDQEVSGRAASLGRFFDQVTSELLLLTSLPVASDFVNSLASPESPQSAVARERVERVYTAYTRAYPYVYQVRFLGTDGREIIRVDRRGERSYVVPPRELQDKSDRYYVQEGLALEPGQVYVSPLDLNIERGKVEVPERPVIRFATPMPDRKGIKRGLIVINLHADFMLGQIQEMAGLRGGNAYLFDRSGSFVSRSAESPSKDGGLHMQSVETLTSFLPRRLLTTILRGGQGTEVLGDWIVAYAPITVGRTLAERSDSSMEWAIASAFPRGKLFEAVFNLYLLYGVLTLSLAATAIGGFVLSRHLLRPLSALSKETEEIAAGRFDHRVEIRGDDEIADLGRRFNAMAGRLDQLYRSIEEQKGRLEIEVQARTQALERERRSLATIIGQSADGILSLTGEGRIELANAAAESLLGGPLDRRPFEEFWTGWRDYLKEEQDAAPAPRRLELGMNGRLLSFSIAPVVRDGQREGHIVMIRDVSEDRRLQDARRELDRQMFQMEKMNTLGELAMGLAHEIGNPLAGMKAAVQMLLEEEGQPERVRQYLGRIEGEVDRLSGFLRSFHGFSAPQETHPAPCRLEDLLDDILLWTRKEARSRGVTISYAPCFGPVPALWADPHQLKQVLLNLVINAIHAMPEGGSIEVGMCAKPEDTGGAVPRMRFCVKDSGAGIAPEVLPKIFDPFYTTRSDGSGLGLAVVKKIAMQHGADIFVESTPGHGTCFEVAWPVAPSGAAGSPEGTMPGKFTCMRGKHG